MTTNKNKVVISQAGRGATTTPTSSTTNDGGRLADERLPEAVDFSEGGWATDAATSLVGFLFFISSLTVYQETDDDDNDVDYNHFKFMYIGTCIAHLFGGMAHRFFPNRAADGVGHRGFYITMALGYGAGNCLRYGFGWGLDPIFGYVAIANATYMVLAGIFVIYKMEHTNELIDDATGTSFRPDQLFGLGEAFCSFMEIFTSIYFVVSEIGFEQVSQSSQFFYVAVAANLVGWAAVYLFALLYLVCNIDYDPSLMQRIFHFAMIVMLWSIDMAVRSAEINDQEQNNIGA